MATKLSESTWTGFTRKQKLDLDDKVLLKALAAFDKTDEGKHEPRLKALDEVLKQIPEQVKALTKRKKDLGDKVFGEAKDTLYALLDAAETLHKEATRSLADEQARRKEEAAGGDDEEESPALLTTKMKPLVRELMKGELAMPCLMALAGKETVVLVSRRTISPARGKLLKDQMQNPGGIKFVRGDCRFENNALIFVVQSPAAALAKRLRQALLDQTGLRLKVRVRGEDGVEEEDGETVADDPQAQPGDATPTAAPPAPADEATAFKARLAAVIERVKAAQAAGHPAAQEARLQASQGGVLATKKDFAGAASLLDKAEALLATAGTGAGADGAAAAACTARRAALEPRILAALQANVGDVAKIRAVAAFVQEKAEEKKDYAAAMKGMDMLDTLLPAQPAASRVTPPTEEDLELDPRFAQRWQKAKAEWQRAMETVNGQLEALRGSLRAADDAELGQIAEYGLNAITANHKVPLDAALIDVDQAPDARKEAAIERALARVLAFRGHIDTDERVQACDDNPFGVTVTIRSALDGALAELEDALDNAFA